MRNRARLDGALPAAVACSKRNVNDLVRIFAAARLFAKYLRFVQFVVGVGLLGLGYHMGKIPMRGQRKAAA